SHISLFGSCLISRLSHLFPTRRSSDLTRPAGRRVAVARERRRTHRGGDGRESARDQSDDRCRGHFPARGRDVGHGEHPWRTRYRDRKSTRLNSSHVKKSYVAYCLTKKR